MINVNLPFGANVDRKENGISCSGPRIETDDERNRDSEETVLESAKDHDLRRNRSNISQQLKCAFGISFHHEFASRDTSGTSLTWPSPTVYR